MISKSPKVSVCMITYGHEKYISQAIEGVLIQETDFNIELVIANDASPDKTHDLINSIINNHPKGYLIKYINHESNIGMMPNFIYALRACEGDFIAICEGDDYWTDPLKLQKQVNFLEANKDYAIHSANATYLSDDLKKNGLKINNNLEDQTFLLQDFLTKNNLFTCTVMFRNLAIEFPESFKKVTFGDWFLYVILLCDSAMKAYRSIDVYSVYRVHNESVTNSMNRISLYEKHIFQVASIKSYLRIKKFNKNDTIMLNSYYKKKYAHQLKGEMYLNAFKTFLEHCREDLKSAICISYVKILIRNFIPKQIK